MMNLVTLLMPSLLGLALASSSFAQDSVFYSTESGPASIGVNVNPRGYQLNLSYDGFLNECDASGYLQPVYVHFIFRSDAGMSEFVRKMSGECRTNSHPEASGASNLILVDNDGAGGKLWEKIASTLGEDDGHIKLELAFERDGIFDNADGMNIPIEL